MSGYEWVSCTNFNIPPKAVECGHDLDGSAIYVGLSSYKGDELPCKVVPRNRTAYVCYDGREIRVDNFKVLCEKKMCWLPGRNGNVPPTAVAAGRTSTGEILYIGRVILQNVAVVGKVHPSHRCLYVPYDGKELSYTQYEVLSIQ